MDFRKLNFELTKRDRRIVRILSLETMIPVVHHVVDQWVERFLILLLEVLIRAVVPKAKILKLNPATAADASRFAQLFALLSGLYGSW